MSNLWCDGRKSGWIGTEMQLLIENSPCLTESDLVTHLESMFRNLEWADVRIWEVPYERIYTIRFVAGPRYECVHIKVPCYGHQQKSEIAYRLWQSQGEPVGQDELFWHMAEDKLKQNWQQWKELYCG